MFNQVSSAKLRGGVLLAASLALVAPTTATAALAAEGEDQSLTGITLEWVGNEEIQTAPPFGGSNYMSAGQSDGSAGTYAASQGDVSILHVAADGTETTPTYATRADHAADAGLDQVMRLEEGDAEIAADGSATVSWNGTWSVNFYGGLTPFWFKNPELTVDSEGNGTLKADLGGYGSSQGNPFEKVRIEDRADVTVATFSGVDIDPSGEVTVSPDYLGVMIDVPAGQTPQNTTSEVWGSWPQEFVEYQYITGLGSYWYSSGGAADSKKVADDFTVDFTDAEVAEPEPVKAGVKFKKIQVAKKGNLSASKKAKGKLELKSNNGSAVKGKVQLKLKKVSGKGSKTKNVMVKNNKASFKLPKLSKGKWKLKPLFKGSKMFKSAKGKTLVLKVRRK